MWLLGGKYNHQFGNIMDQEETKLNNEEDPLMFLFLYPLLHEQDSLPYFNLSREVRR